MKRARVNLLRMMIGRKNGIINCAMGYYTYFTLQLEGPEDEERKLLEDLRASHPKLNELADNMTMEGQWWNWEQCMDAIAQKYPKVLIELTGDGEASDDYWECRWRGVVKEYRVMTIPSCSVKELMFESELNKAKA